MNHPYRVLTSVPVMLGRTRLFEQLERHLLKLTPDHVQVVGPKLYGKTVLLSHLANKYRSGSSAYVASAYVDLRHSTPQTDGEFRQRLAEAIKAALAPVTPSAADFIDLSEPRLHELIVLVLDQLDNDSQRLLVVLDGFDHVLAAPDLTRHLWDQLRALSQKGSIRLVTGSRQPLRTLCRTDESRTSTSGSLC